MSKGRDKGTPGAQLRTFFKAPPRRYADMFPLFPDDQCFLCGEPPDDDFEFIAESWKEGDEPIVTAKICKVCAAKEDRDAVALDKLEKLLAELDRMKAKEEQEGRILTPDQQRLVGDLNDAADRVGVSREELYRKAPALAVADALGRAQQEKENEISARGLGQHPALLGHRQPSVGFGVAGGEVKLINGVREIVGATGDPVVDFYLALMDTQLSESKYQKDETRRMLSRVTWAALRDCSIIKIPGQLYAALYHLADRYTTERVSGQDWVSPEEPPLEKPMSGRQFYQGINELGRHEPLPENRPFDYIYFGYQPKINVNQDLATLYGLHEAKKQGILKRCALAGHLVAPDSVMACLMLELYVEGQLVGGTSMMMERHLGEWNAPYTLAPWIVPSLIEWVNEHKTVVEDTRSLSYRLSVKRWAKKHKIKRLPPPPFYTVRMHDTTLKETAKEGFASRYKESYEYSHRWTVRGHYMVRVRRGPLPLPAKLEAKLRKRKYKIFIHEGPDMQTWQHLRNRNIQPKRVDEWMAVLVSWRKDYVKGPADKPLIPSVRKSGRKRERREGRQEGTDPGQGGTGVLLRSKA